MSEPFDICDRCKESFEGEEMDDMTEVFDPKSEDFLMLCTECLVEWESEQDGS